MRTSQPGPPGHAHAAPWGRWLFPGAVAAGFAALLALPRGAAPGTALRSRRVLGALRHGQVPPTATMAASLTSVLIGLLPLLLFAGLILLGIRGVSRHVRGMGGVGGMGGGS